MSNIGIKRWEKSGDKCPLCGKETDVYVDDVFVYRERCKNCKWEHKFNMEE